MNIRRIAAVALILAIMIGGVSAQDEKRVIRWAMSGEPAVLVDYVTTAGFGLYTKSHLCAGDVVE